MAAITRPTAWTSATPQPIDPPIELPIHDFDLELYVKKKEDLTIAHMLTLAYYNRLMSTSGRMASLPTL